MTSNRVLAAVIKALATDMSCGGNSCWQDPNLSFGTNPDDLTRQDSFTEDSIFHARLRRRLSKLHYTILTAKYSPDYVKKIDAVIALLSYVKSPAPARFRHAATATWALPKPRSDKQERSKLALPFSWYCMDSWCDDAIPIKTQERWRRQIQRDLNRLTDESLAEVCNLL